MAVGVIVAGVWLTADYRKRRTLTPRIEAEERALSANYGLRYSKALARDKPRPKTRQME